MNDRCSNNDYCERDTRIVPDEVRKLEYLAYRYFGINLYN